jgi:threonine dehydrogenase-like Zn-dependent dehydrogenase
MRELQYRAPGELAWCEVAEPRISAPGQALVRPLAVARCDLDLPMVRDGLFPGPFPVGHEMVVEVAEVGSGVRSVQPGQRALVPFQPSCGACASCLRGRFAACATYRAPAGAAFGFGPAGGDHGGAVADLLLVPAADHLLLATPPELSSTVACTLADNVSDGYRAVGPQLLERPGADVLVVGGYGQSIGLYAVGFAVGMGASSVRYADPDPERRRIAATLGAEALAVPDGWPRRFDRAEITVDFSGDPLGLAATLRSTRDNGVCTSVALYFGGDVPLPLLEMYTRGCTLNVSRTDSRAHLATVLALVGQGVFDPAAVPITVAPWEQAATAWLQPAVKLVLQRP